MAPQPEYDKEPKAPDKTSNNSASDDIKTVPCSSNDTQTNLDSKSTTPNGSFAVDDSKQVGALDEGQLRALLNEVYTYKSPKDREGKSSLFKELLEEVEQDDAACEAAAAARGWRGAAGNSSSVQDLVVALAEPSHRRRHAPVSARTLHGGSLPSDVNTSFLMGEDLRSAPVAGNSYVATVRCVNPSPLTERRVSTSDAYPEDSEPPINRRTKSSGFPMTYTARATLEIGSNASAGRAVTTTTPSTQVDNSIPFSCITTPEVVTSSNSTAAIQHTVESKPPPLQLGSWYRAVSCLTQHGSNSADGIQSNTSGSSTFSSLPLTRVDYGSTGTTEEKKPTDENGNAVQAYGTPQANSSLHKKAPRRKKSSKNEMEIKPQLIDGYYDMNINELLRFIESDAEQGKAKFNKAKHKDDSDDKGKKRSSDRRGKDKDRGKRASSLEELSRTKIEDLTDEQDTKIPAPERRSWGHDSSNYYYEKPQSEKKPIKASKSIDIAKSSDSKKHEPIKESKRADPKAIEVKKGAEVKKNDEGKKSNDSKSVESKKIETIDPKNTTVINNEENWSEPKVRSNTPLLTEPELTDFQTVTKRKKQRKRPDESERHRAGPSAERRRKSAPPSDKSNDSNDDLDSVHSLPAPTRTNAHTYADIARTRHNIPDLIESCNFYEAPAPACDPRLYPALGTRARPDLVQRRPPVLLAHSACAELQGVTFGFAVNEQLLAPKQCDLLTDAVKVRDRLAYVPAPPLPPQVLTHLSHIVQYVGHAWEDIVKCGGEKVRYYSE